MLRLRSVATLQRTLSTKAFIQTSDKSDDTKETPSLGIKLGTNKELQQAMLPYTFLENQKTVQGCSNLTDINTIMEIYRLSRDHPERKSGTHASDVVHAILEATRQRDVVFRSLLMVKRSEKIEDQNKILFEFLNEIIEDVKSGKSFLSAYAITYLMTAFSAMGKSAQIAPLWEELNKTGEDRPDLAIKLKMPMVISATLNQADPSTLSLEYIESTYNRTVEESGSNIYLEEALIKGYLHHGDSEKVAEKYLAISQEYSVREHDKIFSRIHNKILTELKDLSVATAFWEMGIRKGSYVLRLHPAAIANYLTLHYQHNRDFKAATEIYLTAISYYTTRLKRVKPADFTILRNRIFDLFMTEYPKDTQEGRQSIQHLINSFKEFYPSDHVTFNIALTRVTKGWLDSDYPQILVAEAMEKLPDLKSDTCSIILNTRPSLEIISKVWAHCVDNGLVRSHNYIALIKSADTPEKAQFAVEQLRKQSDTLNSSALISYADQNVLVRTALEVQ